jgi:rfaE bifunctional protein kinase chain/domain/rfaE bifunctional protein nucleotidyltransferase chain/domain
MNVQSKEPDPGVQSKILSLEQVARRVAALRASGKKVVHCHGVFDLLHVGHIKHLQAAARMGDALVVTITPDRFVNKGPHRPAFPEQLRAEALAALACVRYVAVNNWPTAVETIRLLKPDLFVKGAVKESGPRDHTDAIRREENVVKRSGGRLVLTDEPSFSASTLINQYLDVFTPEAHAFLDRFRTRYAAEEVVDVLRRTRPLRVLVVGETIVDEYQFCEVMGKTSKEPVLAARRKRTEQYAGGILAVANHVAGFCDKVNVLSVLGRDDVHEAFIRGSLRENVECHFVLNPQAVTIVKRRFLEDHLGAKLFEVYEMQSDSLPAKAEAELCDKLKRLLPKIDVVIVADYGHGVLTPKLIDLVCRRAPFLSVNTQTNAGNRGFNPLSRYRRADYVAIGEPEVRLEFRDLHGDIDRMTKEMARRMGTRQFLVTRGNSGCRCFDRRLGMANVPAFAVRVVDRVGAGDAVLAITAPCAATGVPPTVLGFIANVVGAEACAIMGNKSSVEPVNVFRHITSLLK